MGKVAWQVKHLRLLSVIAGTVCTWVELGWGVGLSGGGCSSASVVGYTGVWWVGRPLAVVLTVVIVWYLGGAALI